MAPRTLVPRSHSHSLFRVRPFLLALSLLSCHASPAFTWPTPPGWKPETIPFPLEFAPDVRHRGVEEVRFEPRFFDATADTYFTYSFAWVLDEPRPPSADELASDLHRYFAGLMRSVGQEKHATYPDAAFDAQVTADSPAHYAGEVHTVDAFGDGRAVVLHLDAHALACGAKSVVLVSLSPHVPSDATFQALLAQRATFGCAP
jgi:hypothetical protein